MPRIAKYGLTLLLFFIGIVASAQNQSKSDSILAKIESGGLSTEELMEAYFWASAYSSSPVDELKYAKVLLNLANQENSPEYRIKANRRIGVAQRLMGNLGVAQTYLYESATEAAGDPEFNSLLSDIYAEISTCYTQNGDLPNALAYDLKSAEILRNTDRRQELALTLLNIGYDYYLIGKYDSAHLFYDESEPILKEINLTIGQAYIIGNRGLVFWKQGDTDRAKASLVTAIGMLGDPINDQFAMSDYYCQLGRVYLEENDLEKAQESATKGLELAGAARLKEQMRDANFLLFEISRQTGNHEKAIEYQSQYYAYKDSIQNVETNQLLANLRTDFEIGLKQAELNVLLEQKQRNSIIMYLGGAMLLVLAAILFYRRMGTSV